MSKEPFIKLIEMQRTGGDLKYAHKLSMDHILASGPERQKFRKAAEILSHTVAQAISFNFPNFKHVGDTVTIINNGFDVLNSRVPVCPGNKLKSAYGNSFQEQENALNEFHKLISTMRAAGKKRTTLLPFQKGFIISIKSIRCLYQDLRKEGYTYLLTSRCNQDVLESYFSQVRGIGKFYDHPLPTTVSQRVKTLLLSRDAGKVINSQNCSYGKEIQTLSADIVSDIGLQDENENGCSPKEAAQCDNVEGCHQFEDLDEDFTAAVDGILANVDSCQNNEESVNIVEEKGDLLEFIAGYIAYRIRKKFPEKAEIFGHFTKDLPVLGKNWVSTMSRGHLMKPSDEFFEDVKKMEKEFQRFHGVYIY